MAGKSYKMVDCKGELSGVVSDALGIMQALRDEVEGIVENAGDALANTQRIQTFSETKDTLDNHVDDEPDAPACIAERNVSYSEARKKAKNKGASRAVQLSNACGMLEAVKDEAQEYLDNSEEDLAGEEIECWGLLSEKEQQESDERFETIKDEIETYVGELEEIIDGVEGCEFPGMYG